MEKNMFVIRKNSQGDATGPRSLVDKRADS